MTGTRFYINIEKLRDFNRQHPLFNNFHSQGTRNEITITADIVKHKWISLSFDEKELLRNLAYNLITNEQNNTLEFYGDDVICLVENILDAIEREDPRYEQELLDGLKEAELVNSGKILNIRR